MESIVFRWRPDAGTNSIGHTVEWVTVDADGRPHISTKTGSLNDLARQLNSSTPKKQAIALLPANYYSLHEASLPPKLSASNIRKAAPFAIEDELVDAISDYHFACGELDKNEQATLVNIAAINKTAFTSLIDELAEYHIQPRYAYPEDLLLPYAENMTTIFIEDDVIHSRTQAGLAHTLPIDLLTTVIDDIDDSKQIKIISHSELDSPFAMDNIEYEVTDRSLLSMYVKQLGQHKPVNLLQGEFKYQEEIGKHIKPWRWPFTLACLALLVAFVGQLLVTHQLETQNAALQDQKLDIYKGVFPKSRNVNVYSVRTRMEQALKKAGGNTAVNSSFVPLLKQYADVITDNSIAINDISYSKNKLSLTLLAKDIQVLDQIKVKLEQSKRVIANILSSKTVGDGVEATLKLELR